MLARCIDSVNVVLGASTDDAMGDMAVSPAAGSVVFGSGVHSRGFTLPQFARHCAKKVFGCAVPSPLLMRRTCLCVYWCVQLHMRASVLATRLWGDWYFNASTQSWSRVNDGKCKRGFIALIWCVYD